MKIKCSSFRRTKGLSLIAWSWGKDDEITLIIISFSNKHDLIYQRCENSFITFFIFCNLLTTPLALKLYCATICAKTSNSDITFASMCNTVFMCSICSCVTPNKDPVSWSDLTEKCLGQRWKWYMENGWLFSNWSDCILAYYCDTFPPKTNINASQYKKVNNTKDMKGRGKCIYILSI